MFRTIAHSFRCFAATIFSLTAANIAGDNIAVVPLLATGLKEEIYSVIIVAYFGIGACLAGLCAWLGAVTRDELPQMIEWSAGRSGKDLAAWAILGVCLPASALTGGMFSGTLLADIFHISPLYGALLALLGYTCLAFHKNRHYMLWVNALALVGLPLLLYGCLRSQPLMNSAAALPLYSSFWPVVWALVGYNAGGLRPLLVTETGSYLVCRWTAVIVAIAAKWLEGLITLVFAYAVVNSGAIGILPVGQLLENQWGAAGRLLYIVSYCSLFFSCMVPAMAVNAHQIRALTDMNFSHSLLWAIIIVLSITFLGLNNLLSLLSLTGIVATLTTVGFFVHVIRRFREEKELHQQESKV